MMISRVKYTPSPLSTFASSKLVPIKLQFCTIPKNVKHNNTSFKPLYISSTHENFKLSTTRRVTECKAYEADRSQPLEINIDLPNGEQAQKVKIGLYFATWWALNVVFNIYNKKVLNAFPYPWLTSTLSLAAGSLIMLISWATRIADAPKVDFDFWKALFPVSKSYLFSFFIF